MGEIAEAEGGAAEVFEAAVDRLGRTIAGAGSIKEHQHICGAFGQGAAELGQLRQGVGDLLTQRGDELRHRGSGLRAVEFSIGGGGGVQAARSVSPGRGRSRRSASGVGATRELTYT